MPTETPEVPTLAEAAAAVEAFIAPARAVFHRGGVVHLTVCPGDGTRYALTFVPPTTSAWWTSSPYADPALSPEQALLIVHTLDRSVIITPTGYPVDNFVAEKLRTDNRFTVLAVGLAWFLMVGNAPERAAEAFAGVIREEPGKPNPLTEWDLSRFTVESGA